MYGNSYDGILKKKIEEFVSNKKEIIFSNFKTVVQNLYFDFGAIKKLENELDDDLAEISGQYCDVHETIQEKIFFVQLQKDRAEKNLMYLIHLISMILVAFLFIFTPK